MNIISNGSKWAGESPDTLETLLEVLTREPLDPSFEKYGNFVLKDRSPVIRVWGNFFALSHVFSIDGTAEELAPLIAAIRLNQCSAAYQDAKRQRRDPNGSYLFPKRTLASPVTT